MRRALIVVENHLVGGYKLGRLPVGFLQLTHNPGRFAAALAGVAFANVLVFVQLGLAGSMYESVATPYRLFQPNLLLISPRDTETLADTATLPRQRMFVSLERRMHCGMGKCCRCNVGSTFTCLDGPVFDYWSVMNLKEAI